MKKKTYDVQFDDANSTNRKGFIYSYRECLDYIKHFNGTNESYFEDYKGGTVSVVCNEDGTILKTFDIK